MRAIARQLISEELNRRGAAETEARAAIRVCDKLGRALALVAGNRGYRSLLARALALASAEVSWLTQAEVGPGGSLELSAEAEAKLGRKEAERGGLALVGHLLELLATFIGEALTLRLVQQVWPKAALNPVSKGKA